MIVDDSSLIRQRLVAMLSRIEGVTVVGEAGTGAQALEKIVALEPDVVTLDIMMSNGTGVEALERIAKLESPPTCIVLTNYPYPAFRKRCLQLGAKHFLSKAAEFDRIPAILEDMVAEQRGRGA